MDILILYKSKYEATRQYAEWIHEMLASDIVPLEDASPELIDRYDTIIVGTYDHGGKKSDIQFMLENWDVLRTKHVLLYAVSPQEKGVGDDLASLPKQVTDRLFYLPLPGRLKVKELDFSDKAALRIGQLIKRFSKKPKPFTLAARNFHSPVKKEYVEPLIQKVNELKANPAEEFAGY